MINIVGMEYLETNIENDEFSYPKAYNRKGFKFNPIVVGNRKYEKLDIRFVKKNISVLIETKKDFNKDSNAERQLSAYVGYEKDLTGNNIIAILANTQNDKIKVWKDEVTPENLLENEKSLRNMEEYEDF
ncbi:SAM-dependent DNA methyltransferase, partial [bacterium]|nr:SAM-dependent DNA methyltransferase [bacterium]